MNPALVTIVVVLSLAAIARADDPKSGPAEGEQVASFKVRIAEGDNAGNAAEPLVKFEKKPVLVILWGEVTRPGFGLLKKLDKYARLRQPEGLEILIVRLGDDPDALLKHQKLLADRYDVKGLAGASVDGKTGPEKLNLHAEAEMTVLLLDKDHRVLHNLARRAPEQQDFDDVRKAIDKLLGPSPVPFE